MTRVFETIAAFIPVTVFLIHLTVRSASAQPVVPAEKLQGVVTNETQAKLATSVTVVPEPNCLALSGLGLALLFQFRRKVALQPSSPTKLVL